MYSTKSFCSIFAFASNEPGINSPIGELTTYAETFSKELGTYHHSSLMGYDLHNFYSVDGTTRKQMPVNVVDQAIGLVDKVTTMTLSTSGELYCDEVLTALKTTAEGLKAMSVNMGQMISDGTHWVPEWISWQDGTPGAGDTDHRVWIGIEAFKAQYTEYEIVVSPPFDDLDSFFNPGNIVEARVKAITPTQIMERAEAAKDGNPETITRTDPYEYRDPVQLTRRFDVYWTVIIYGIAGNDPDIIRDALVKYILAHSTHSRDEWAVIFPDIFKRTEFVIAPFYDQWASEQSTFNLQGIYSPIVDQAKPVAWLTQQAPDYSTDHLKANAQVMGFPLRSMAMATIGNIENRDGKVKITDYYPDFINVGTESTDFGRMSPTTQAWAVMMMDLLKLAESATPSTDLPRLYYRVTRGNKVYIGKTHDRLLFLALARYSYTT